MEWLTKLTDDAIKGFCASGSPVGGMPAVAKCMQRARAQIVSVGFTDKSKSSPLFGGTRAQYVNLTSEELLSIDSAPGGALASTNQLGRTPPIAVKVTPAQSIAVRLQLVREEVRGNFPAGSETLSAREARLCH